MRVSEKVEGWKHGSYDASFGAEAIARNACAKGYCSACEDMLNITFEDLQENGK